MLVLRRRLGESIVFGDELVLTVSLLADDYVELTLITVNGSLLGTLTAHRDEYVTIADEIRVIASRFDPDCVRLGIEAPANWRISRGEFWNL
jgi:sRNA-binding carbon storage regulator CsrA